MAFILQLECLQRVYWLKIFEKKNLFQILRSTGSCIEEVKMVNFCRLNQVLPRRFLPYSNCSKTKELVGRVFSSVNSVAFLL